MAKKTISYLLIHTHSALLHHFKPSTSDGDLDVIEDRKQNFLVLGLEPDEDMENHPKPYLCFEARNHFMCGYDKYTESIPIRVESANGEDLTPEYPQIQEYNRWINKTYKKDFISGFNEEYQDKDLRIIPHPDS